MTKIKTLHAEAIVGQLTLVRHWQSSTKTVRTWGFKYTHEWVRILGLLQDGTELYNPSCKIWVLLVLEDVDGKKEDILIEDATGKETTVHHKSSFILSDGGSFFLATLDFPKCIAGRHISCHAPNGEITPVVCSLEFAPLAGPLDVKVEEACQKLIDACEELENITL